MRSVRRAFETRNKRRTSAERMFKWRTLNERFNRYLAIQLICCCFFFRFPERTAGGSCVALTVVSPVYGSTHPGNGVAVRTAQSAYGMPASSGLASPIGGSAPPPPPPPPSATTPTGTSRGLHHQPSMRVGGITSPQPVGVRPAFFSYRVTRPIPRWLTG